MPGKYGYETFHELRAIRSDLNAIIVSAYSHTDVAARFRDYDIAAIIQKPYNYSDLIDYLHALWHPGSNA